MLPEFDVNATAQLSLACTHGVGVIAGVAVAQGYQLTRAVGQGLTPLEVRDVGAMVTISSDDNGPVPKVMRKRGVERFHRLLDATAELLSQRPEEDISLAQIAERAAVPLASVYHFFPNRNAAFVALAKRYHSQIAESMRSAIRPTPATWQDYIARRQRIGADYLNANPAALRLFMGAGVSVEVRNTDLHGNADLARARAAYLVETFEMPSMTDLEDKVAVSIALVDGIWALSYSRHGQITEAYLEQSIRAAVAYLRCYLPEVISLRGLSK